MPDGNHTSLSVAKMFDAVCDRFEADWRAGKAPRIEDVLQQVDGSDPEEVLRALLPVELDLRRQRGERVNTTEYKRRFPEHTAIVVAVFREVVERSKSAVAKTSARPGSTQDEKKLTDNEPATNAPSKSGSNLLKQVYGEVRQDALAAVEATVRRSRARWWLWLAAPVLTAVIAVLGFYFFGRTPTAIVTLNVGVDLTDKALSFVMDGKPIEAEKLMGPIELAVGIHELMVYRNRSLIKTMRFVVTKDGPPGQLLQPENVIESDSPEAGFVSLFNGKDLSGWKTYPDDRAKWEVVDGCITASGPIGHLFSVRDDYRDFVYRIEARINDRGDSGQYFRAAFEKSYPRGYEAQINVGSRDAVKTGSLHPNFNRGLSVDEVARLTVLKPLHQADEWFTQEVTAIGNHITIKVNGQTTTDWIDESWWHSRGHFALQHNDPRTRLSVRKVEVKELNSEPRPSDAERDVADWALRSGAYIDVAIGPSVRQITRLVDLPDGPIRVTNIDFKNDAARGRKVTLDRERYTPLAKLKYIKSLRFWTGDINGNDLPNIAGLTTLEHLVIWTGSIGDPGVARLKGLVNLQSLNLVALGATGKTADSLRGLTKLRSLSFYFSGFNDAGLARLPEFPNLDYLGLDHTKLTDAGLSSLKRWPSLTHIKLNETAVTDAGLPQLAGLTKLRKLEIMRTKATEAGAEKLRRQMPWCEVVYSQTPRKEKDPSAPPP